MKYLPKSVKIFASLFMAAIWILFSLASPARADLGPKPTMVFEFEPAAGLPNLLVLEGSLLECDDDACIQSHPLEDFGPQGFTCFGTTCHAVAYSFSDYHRLVLTFSDGVTRESNIFTKRSFEANYMVTIGKKDLFVEEGRGYPNPNILFFGMAIVNMLLLAGAFLSLVFLIRKGAKSQGWMITALVISLILIISGGFLNLALPATIAIELLLAAAYTQVRKRPLLPTFTLVCLANVITQFALWAALNTFIAGNAMLLTIGLEIIIWGVEALIFYLPQQKDIALKEAALLSLLLNLISFGIGLLLPI